MARASIATGPRRDLLGRRPHPEQAGAPAPPPPRVELGLIGPFPGAVVRVVPGLLVLACAAIIGRDNGVAWFLATAAAVTVTVRPALPVPALVAGVVGLIMLGGDDLTAGTRDDGLLRMAALVLSLHLLLRVSGLAAHIGWRGVVEAPVLARLGRSVLGAQLVAQGLLLAVVSVRSSGASAGQEWLRAVAVGAVVVVALLVVPRSWLARRVKPRG
ncbi:MAG TPA: hypothetical protein VGK35_13415 [Actinotalea sp.]